MFALPSQKTKNQKRNKYCDLTRELRKLRNMRGTRIPIETDEFGRVHNGLLGKKSETNGNQKTNRGHLTYSLIEIDRITQKNKG